MPTKYDRIDPTVEMLVREFEYDRLYGTVEIKFEAGRVVLLKKSETIKPLSDRDIRGDEGER